MVSFIVPFLVSLAAALIATDQAPKPLSFTLNKHPKTLVVRPLRGGSVSDVQIEVASVNANARLFSDGEGYTINLGIIDEDQQLLVLLDTGSADLWVDATKLNDTNGFTKVGIPFAIGYGYLSSVRGDYGTSSVWLENGLEVKDLRWVLASDVQLNGTIYPGILGVGRVLNEATRSHYPNFPQKLKDNGLTTSNSYSYYLNKLGAATSNIIFGGRDLAKVKGPVATINSNPKIGYDSVTVLKLTTSDGISVNGFEGFLDTGTTLTFLPEEVITNLNVTGVYVDQDLYYIACDQPEDEYVSYWFDDAEIKVLYKDLALPETDDLGKPTGRCVYGLQAGPPYVFGDTFLRSAYITTNHDTNQVLISAVEYTDEENIVAI